MKKDFDRWNIKKKSLDVAVHQPPLVSEGDLWWCATGENVGVETSGKGSDFTRPIVVLKKFGKISFFGIPTTTRKQKGRMSLPCGRSRENPECNPIISPSITMSTAISTTTIIMTICSTLSVG